MRGNHESLYNMGPCFRVESTVSSRGGFVKASLGKQMDSSLTSSLQV